SCVDAANPAIFVRAADLGVDPAILPNDFNKLPEKLARLEKIRRRGAVLMGMVREHETPPRVIPKIAIVSPRGDQKVLSGKTMPGSQLDVVVRFISDTQPHRAIPLTGALCTAAAAKVPGSIVQQCLPEHPVKDDMITIGHSSGQIQVNAKVDANGNIESATVFRTARRIMEGKVFWNE
ncbi:MAG: PrpF family protein, partial [Terriglobus roseus]|nr:PrpF family protein [Terriglobus roseus]